MGNVRILEVKQSIFESNDKQAALLREELKKDGVFLLNLMSSPDFPESCVLYLRSSKVTPDTLKVKVNLPFGEKDNSFIYECKTIKLKDYTSDDIFKKKLLILLPFYIMKYEKKNKICIENEEELKQLLNEYDKIRVKLEETLIENQKSTLYTDLIKLIIKISNYVLQEEPEIKKGVEKIMGGKVLQLESERLEKKGINIGRKEGLKEGKNIGRKEGIDALIQTIKRFMPNAIEEDIVNEIKKMIATNLLMIK